MRERGRQGGRERLLIPTSIPCLTVSERERERETAGGREGKAPHSYLHFLFRSPASQPFGPCRLPRGGETRARLSRIWTKGPAAPKLGSCESSTVPGPLIFSASQPLRASSSSLSLSAPHWQSPSAFQHFSQRPPKSGPPRSLCRLLDTSRI